MSGAPLNAAAVQNIIGERLLSALEAAEERMDEQLAAMDKMGEDELERLRVSRLEAMKAAARQKSEWLAMGHGSYREIDDQKRFFEEMKKERRAVVHFYRPSTRRCEVLDRHLGDLARAHVETRFVRVNAERAPFLAERLKIWMLPTLVLIKDGRTDHSILGFDEMGGGDDFGTDVLEALLVKYGVCEEGAGGGARRRRGGGEGDGDDVDDS